MTIHLANTLPRPHSIPYQLEKPANDIQNEAFAPTYWLVLNPGVNVDIEDEIWEAVKTHPDVKTFLDERSLVVFQTLSVGKTEQFQDVTALTDGTLTKSLDQPVPITEAKIIQTLGNPVEVDKASKK